MYGSPAGFRPRGGRGRGGRNQPIAPHSNFLPENPNFISYPSSSYAPSWRGANPSFPNSIFHPSQIPQKDNYVAPYQNFTVELLDAAVAKAQKAMLDAEENASVWKISQSVARSLKVSSWDALGFRTVDVPNLREIQFVEGKVNAFIHCFVNCRKMTSVYELGLDICKNEGVEKFEELGIGPLLRHPLVHNYFSVSPDAKEICEITTEDLVNRLSTFLYRKNRKEIEVEEFLDFLVQKCSVASREHLGVRIRSMGLFIKYIRAGRRAESASLRSINEMKFSKEEVELPSQSVPPRKLSSLIDDECGYPHEESGALDDVDFDDNSTNRGCTKHERSDCNDESHIHDGNSCGKDVHMITQAVDGELVAGKKKKGSSRGAVEVKKDPVIENFINTWKDAFKKHPAQQVLSMMIDSYGGSEKKKRKLRNNFSSPLASCILNVAVRFLKGENFVEVSDQHDSLEQNVCQSTEMLNTDPSIDGKLSLSDDHISKDVKKSVDVSADDIIKQICYFIEPDGILSERGICLEKQLVLRACEMWLRMYFSVKEFKCLNHGDFLEFVDNYASHLPDDKHHLLAGEITRKSIFEVSMFQKQFLVFLHQAMENMDKDIVVRPENVSVLLRKQFPLISLKVTAIDLHGNISNIIKCQEKNDASSVTFSATLLGNVSGGSLLAHHEKSDKSSNVISERDGPFGSLGHVSAKDAIDCLLKAPMLLDLKAWSHWDLVFAPSLGSLLEWLLNQGPMDELSCIVTSDGRIIRIDHSATPDDFFEASIRGSSFQAALKLLSLLQIYGGSYKAPVSLLKCYFQQAIDVLTETFSDDIEWNVNSNHSSLVQNKLVVENGSSSALKCPSKIKKSREGRELFDELSQISKSYSSISVFILECLDHLPSEFRSFAADILVSGLQFFTRNAYEIILHECRHVSQRIMLHDIGLSLGILEWIKDYNDFISVAALGIPESFETQRMMSEKCVTPERPFEKSDFPRVVVSDISNKDFTGELIHTSLQLKDKDCEVQNAAVLIEQIRKEEFGLGSDSAENDLLKKQHDRLGRALNCLSRELYSQDSHIILELIQNADDNSYPENMEPTLVFILQDNGVIVLNNELGFSAQNMRALCDIGSSTKKGSSGYIGQKGIGFKSVFRVTDAPEIHSNGFHVKFDINEGQIGFVLPTVVPPCDIDFFKRQVLCDTDQLHDTSWNTCIVLPFKSELKSGKGMNPILSMFSDIHPHLLLFLQRLQCIKYKNMITNELVILRRESNDNGIVTVSLGKDKMSWLLINRNLEPTLIRPDVQTTKITLAFPLEESENMKYKAHLDQQHVFAFLPLRKYGLKFILQGDFILPSSREEVDGNSAWNQWLLSWIPDLFVSAEKSFCALPCFHGNLGKAVTEFMSFVPLMGEVYGFFSDLPRMILKELRKSNCLLLDGSSEEWAPPCRVLRNCDDQIRNFLTTSLLQQHLGLGFLHRDIILHDSLARELGVHDYGAEFLVRLQSSICYSDGSRSLDLEWLSCWLNALCISLSFNASKYFTSSNTEMEFNLIRKLKDIPFIPLSDGSYVSVAEGPVWLPFDISTLKSEAGNVLKHLPGLYSKLKTVSCLLFSTEFVKSGKLEENRVENVIRVLVKVGVRQLSSHDVIRNHILPSISCTNLSGTSTDLMTQYLFYIMIHLQSTCSSCKTERAEIISELQKQTIILTNNGYMCPLEKPIHFSNEFCNRFDIKKLIDDVDIEWNELDIIYLQHPTTQFLFNGLNKWREFFLELGVTDFLQVRCVEKNVQDVLGLDPMNMSVYTDVRNGESVIMDWESSELVNLLSAISTKKHLDKCKYLLHIFDKMWDGCYELKSKCHSTFRSGDRLKKCESSFMKCLHKFKWVASSLDDELHCPEDVFHDCKAVRSILGTAAPYAVPKIKSKRFVEDIGLKVQVMFVDVIRVLKHWRNSKISASILQMTKLYTFVRDEFSKSKQNIIEFKSDIIIFVPSVSIFEQNDAVPGKFMLPETLFWHDPTGCMEKIREISSLHNPGSETEFRECPPLSILYPGLYDFLVTDCGASEAPSFRTYLRILRCLSNLAVPSQVTHEVFQVFLKWADDFKLELLGSDEVNELKDYLSKSENAVLPTISDTWVSLNPTFGIICWTDEEKNIEHYKDFDDVHFLQFGELTAKEREMLRGKVSIFLQNIGIHALTEVVFRKAIPYGITNNDYKTSLVNWILPYIQRYLYKMHPDRYLNLKGFEFSKTIKLQVVVVEKLYYKNSIRGRDGPSGKRFACSCLLEENIFYTTQDTDSHALFLELSRFFFQGTPNLYMANFLHIITSKAELGHTEEQIEPFIVDSLKVPPLPKEETLWVLDSPDLSNLEPSSHSRTKHRYTNLPVNTISKLCWPPVNWKNSSGLSSNLNSTLPSDGHEKVFKNPAEAINLEDGPVPSPADELSKTDADVPSASHETVLTKLPKAINLEDVTVPSMEDNIFTENEMTCLKIAEDDRSYKAGRLGEMIACRYFTEKLGEAAVKWLNRDSEMGLPYDLIIEQNSKMVYVEVKSTVSAAKNWFPLSTNEWHCAIEKEESFMIARVVLSSAANAKVLIFKNPAKLCRENVLHLALIQPVESENSAI